MYKVKSRIWIETQDGMFLGYGHVKLLEAIISLGSLSKAAKSLNMSYKKAWNLTDALNKKAIKEVVSTSVGGKDGGGAKVTNFGKELIKKFEDLNHETEAFLNEKMNFNE